MASADAGFTRDPSSNATVPACARLGVSHQRHDAKQGDQREFDNLPSPP